MDIISKDESEPTVVTDEVTAPEHEENPPLLDPSPEPETKVHPLSPGGKRFEQIYAKGKQAEREVVELRERIALLESKSAPAAPASTEKEYTWAELETFIQQGRISRADAEVHREEIRERKLLKTLETTMHSKSREQTRDQVLTQTISEYVQSVPAVLDETSADRVRLDEEFDWLASAQGLDPAKVDGVQRKALQAAALRNVYGPIDSVKKRSVPAKAEPSQGISGGIRPPVTANKDQQLLNGLSQPQVAHYKKMMAAGRYKGGWKDVVAELKYDPKTRTKKA